MQRRRTAYSVFTLLALVAGLLMFNPGQAQAAAIQIRPLQYRESLDKGSSKKGFVDVSNPSASAVSLRLEVQAFRQVDNGSRLQFYDAATIRQGIQLDLTEVDLGPQEAVRVYFVVRGDILPEGDVFAALFATTRTQVSDGIAPSARVGTLLIIQNARPGPRQADITAIRTSLLQFGDSVNGTVTLRNPANPDKPSGFYPEVRVSLRPIAGSSQTLQAPLIMAGVSRDVPFDMPSNRVGLYQLIAVSGDSSSTKWLFLVTGYWRWLIGGLLILVAVLSIIYRHMRHRFKSNRPGPLPGASELRAVPPDASPTQPIVPINSAPVSMPLGNSVIPSAEQSTASATEPISKPVAPVVAVKLPVVQELVVSSPVDAAFAPVEPPSGPPAVPTHPTPDPDPKSKPKTKKIRVKKSVSKPKIRKPKKAKSKSSTPTRK